jgi:2-oxoglutarate dehydrogenase E1 component
MAISESEAAGQSVELNSQSLEFVERLFAHYAADPASVPGDWRQFFRALSNGVAPATPAAMPSAPQASGPSKPAPVSSAGDGHAMLVEREPAARQERVDQLIRNHRVRGHIIADLDPLDRRRPQPPELDPGYYGFTEADYDREFVIRTARGLQRRTLREICRWLRCTYCRTIGVQYMHIDSHVIREWLQERMEETENRIQLSREEQLRILERLTAATVFESFLETKFTGAKSFSLAGAESLIPLLDLAIEKAGADGVEEIVLAMAHRGRLNVLANVIGKKPREIFREFQDLESPGRTGPGDVKYHLGYSSDWTTSGGRSVHLSLSFNPSHLEFVNPVALGRMRAKQDRYGDAQRRRGLVILIHGDAAFIGEGVVQETLNLSELPGYRVGGTLHVIVNNQIGFTTLPEEAQSSIYCSDVAKMLQIPIFHVNGEDPEAVAQVVHLALDFRKEFQRDSVIDMYSYRLRGHNEGDEPSFTQPLMYKTIARQRSVRDGYLERLLQLNGVTREEAERVEASCRARLEKEFEVARRHDFQLSNPTPTGVWAQYHGGPASEAADVETAVSGERISELLESQTRFPEGFHLHPKLVRAVDRRREMAEGQRPLDWSAAEAVALASLAAEGLRVRISGQDTARGTFSQRHAVLHDYENGSTYMPLHHVAKNQAPVEIINSPLSEAGVLGFEYGYSLDYPDGLVAWEAQFGDFVNAGQVAVDQFIASAEAKWRRLSGLVLLLPHGFEGQGPEHSSARLERFLALAADDNIQVVYPSTPAQYFHCLRRQVLRRWRKPLVIITPKGLLRHRECVSELRDFAAGRFHCLLEDPSVSQAVPDSPPRAATVGQAMPDSPPRAATVGQAVPDSSPDSAARHAQPDLAEAACVLLCSGKIHYDLQAGRRENENNVAAILRVEQLYPLPVDELRAALSKFPESAQLVWVQEEPENMGAWRFMHMQWLQHFADRPLECVSRPASASPATGSKTAHEREQRQLIERALGMKK